MKRQILVVDDEAVNTGRAAYAAFLQQQALSFTAKWLNANGYKVKREVRGGNHRPRLGYFTVDNLHWILSNKSYIGIRVYKVKGEVRESKAVWPAIIDPKLFDQVQSQLKANRFRKFDIARRYPFQLTGLLECDACKGRMVGRSAHGNSGKVPYYDHSWAIKKKYFQEKESVQCKPCRVQVKKLEPAVWEKVSTALNDPKWAKNIVHLAQQHHKENLQNSEIKKTEERIRSLDEQMEVLAERLSELPKSVPATPIYQQMQKLEARKTEEQARIIKLQNQQITRDVPVPLKSYQSFLHQLALLADKANTESLKTKLLHKLTHKIQITPNGFKIHYRVGRDYIEGELARKSDPKNLFLISGSTTLTNGGPTKNRT